MMKKVGKCVNMRMKRHRGTRGVFRQMEGFHRLLNLEVMAQ